MLGLPLACGADLPSASVSSRSLVGTVDPSCSGLGCGDVTLHFEMTELPWALDLELGVVPSFDPPGTYRVSWTGGLKEGTIVDGASVSLPYDVGPYTVTVPLESPKPVVTVLDGVP